ncbi:MAG: glycosyltransferase family protein [Calditrichaeota bacterium]|nr:glycosyltransferase family protein [Calditrichota bacterium]HQU72043.1 glycosyltransferase family protein [Calditrichia bacterium]
MNSATTVTIIQARMGSSRLPGKVMMPLCGRPLLQRLLERVQRSRLKGTVVVATTDAAEDREIVRFCRDNGYFCFAGHPSDLLDRHLKAAQLFGANVVVKIPSDCPLIDPEVIDQVIGTFHRQHEPWDYLSNLHPPTYPDGNDVEVMTFAALERAHREAVRPLEREHTTPYFWENPRRFRIGNVLWETGRNLSMSHRWTIDYPEDYQFIRAVYEALLPRKADFGLQDILDLLENHPEIAGINRRFCGVNWYRHHLDELRAISPEETRREPQPKAKQ